MSKYINIEQAIEIYRKSLEQKRRKDRQMRLIDADELITAFPCGESVRTESVRATIKNMPTIEVSEDAISREWLIGYFSKGAGTFADNTETIVHTIKSAPSVIPKVPNEGE